MPPLNVLVTGAGGRTGAMALKKMAAQKELFNARGTARTEASAATIRKETGAECGLCDITKPESIEKALTGVEVLTILSSATPKPNWFKLLGFFVRKLCGCGKNSHMGEAFEYPTGGMPEKVDWEGQRNLITAAQKAGVQHVILVSSMGGTQIGHFLNKMGDGNILLWKRKAEKFLMSSGIPYTIIHPGGLLPHRGNKVVPGGERKLVVGVDDELMNRDAKHRCIPREDVAEVVVKCALCPEAKGRSFDLVSDPPSTDGQGVWDGDMKALLATLDGKNCDYSIPSHEILGE